MVTDPVLLPNAVAAAPPLQPQPDGFGADGATNNDAANDDADGAGGDDGEDDGHAAPAGVAQ